MRTSNPRGLVAVLVIAFIVVAVGGYELANHYLAGVSDVATANCHGNHAAHQVVISNNVASPHHTEAALCDTLSITNLDSQERLIAFGPHEHHISYDGVSERLLSQGQSLTVTLIKPGTYLFHDHIDDSLTTTGDFTVAAQ